MRVEVELSQEERRLYEAARVSALTEIKELGDQPRFALLAMLTRLRQLACHPWLSLRIWATLTKWCHTLRSQFHAIATTPLLAWFLLPINVSWLERSLLG